MESLSFNDLEIIRETLSNIEKSISLLMEWNENLKSSDEWLSSPLGMQKLAGNCMLIEAIGEAVKNIDKRAGMEFLNLRPEIPWKDIMSMRNHIAHGYFELDESYVFSVIKNDLEPLNEAVKYLILETDKILAEKEVDERCQ